ncbi:MAG TPA: hypothetical protein VGB04_07875 [Allosphingosinicella sp.]|jgi:hypothetical protein
MNSLPSEPERDCGAVVLQGVDDYLLQLLVANTFRRGDDDGDSREAVFVEGVPAG